MELETSQEFAIIAEAETGVFLLVEGLIAWDRLSGANDFRHLPMQLVSQGLERLLKLTLILAELEQGRLPTLDEVKKKYGHRLTALTERLAAIMRDSSYASSRPVAAQDLDFIQEDAEFARLLKILSSFAQQGRYHNLNVVFRGSQSSQESTDPVWDLSEFETELMQSIPEWADRIMNDFDSLHQEISNRFVTLIQRFARAICRMYTLGPLGTRGKQLTATISRFLYLRDEQLADIPKRRFEH